MWDSSAFLGALTPKFYVALTGTSSLISGIILIFEWWYFRKYGTSFIEQVSISHLGPWLGGAPSDTEPTNTSGSASSSGLECKVVRNPMALLRGAEYGRLWTVARQAPLTYFDMNLSAQDHQAWFGCTTETPADECMSRAWREREPGARVAAARAALARQPDCAAALLLLAEEEAPTVLEAERVLRRALRAAESAWRSHAHHPAAASSPAARRDATLLAHVKRRAGVCARRLGRLRDAARVFRELARDAPPSLHAPHENLLEVLLEQRLYADAAAVLARHEDAGGSPSAATLYTAALLRARSPNDPLAGAALRRAIQFNPYVPEYLLELRALALPPEHVVRRGDSEALSYAFWHLRHWHAAEPPALRLLAAAWRAAGGAGGGALGAGALGGGPGAGCAQCADRELMAGRSGSGGGCGPGMAVNVARQWRRWVMPAGAAICGTAAMVALAARLWPNATQWVFDPRRLQSLLAAV